MMSSSWYDEEDELIDALTTMKLYIPVMHCEKHIGEVISKGEFREAYRRFDINCRIARAIGAESIVVHLWNGITSDANFQNNIDAYSRLKDIADKYDINRVEYKGTITLEATPFGSDGAIDIKILNKPFEFIRNAMD